MFFSRLINIVVLLVGILFLFFAYLQINDPDSFIWVIAYLIPAILSFSSLLNYRSKYSQYLSPIYLILAFNAHFNNSETNEMHIFSEATNESLGLVLSSIWIIILVQLNNCFIKKS